MMSEIDKKLPTPHTTLQACARTPLRQRTISVGSGHLTSSMLGTRFEEVSEKVPFLASKTCVADTL